MHALSPYVGPVESFSFYSKSAGHAVNNDKKKVHCRRLCLLWHSLKNKEHYNFDISNVDRS